MAGRRPSGRHRRARRAGFTLVELLVVLAIVVGIIAVAVPSLYALFDLEQRGAARQLAMTYQFLSAEAAMRNVTFRVAYYLDEGSYEIQVGDPDTLVFTTPEARAEYEEQQERRLRFASKETEEAVAAEAEGRFSGLELPGFDGKVTLPSGSRFGFVYTPQYEEPQTPSEEEPDPEDPPRVAYSYVFASGEVEYTVVRIVAAGDAEDGYSVEVEPVSGNVRVESEPTEIGASLAWLPAEAPRFQ